MYQPSKIRDMCCFYFKIQHLLKQGFFTHVLYSKMPWAKGPIDRSGFFPLQIFVSLVMIFQWKKGLSTDVAFFHGRFYSILTCFECWKRAYLQMWPFSMVGFILFWHVLWLEKGLSIDVAFFHGRCCCILACFMVGKKLQTDDFDIVVFP